MSFHVSCDWVVGCLVYLPDRERGLSERRINIMPIHDSNTLNLKDEKIRKFQIDDASLMFGGIFGKDLKIMFKDLTESPAEHVTLRIDKDGSFDVHKTKEGKEKSYIRLEEGKIKFNANVIQKLVESFLQSKVNIHDPLYQDFIVLMPKNEEAFKKFFYETSTRKKDRITISVKNEERILESFRKYFHLVKLEEVD